MQERMNRTHNANCAKMSGQTIAPEDMKAILSNIPAEDRNTMQTIMSEMQENK